MWKYRAVLAVSRPSKSVCAKAHKGSNPFLSARTRLSRSKSRKGFLAVFAFENMEGGTYELFEL